MNLKLKLNINDSTVLYDELERVNSYIKADLQSGEKE